jgi:hypothetical protein
MIAPLHIVDSGYLAKWLRNWCLQEVRARNNCLLSSDITWTTYKMTYATVLLMLHVYSLPEELLPSNDRETHIQTKMESRLTRDSKENTASSRGIIGG